MEKYIKYSDFIENEFKEGRRQKPIAMKGDMVIILPDFDNVGLEPIEVWRNAGYYGAIATSGLQIKNSDCLIKEL